MQAEEDIPSPIHALRYIATSEGGFWQIRRGADIEEVNSLRNFQSQAGTAQAAANALAQPATWIEVRVEE